MYNHAPENYICPFCMLIQGIEDKYVISVQSDIIYHNTSVTASISSHQRPNNPGNVIIMPNEHFENIYDLPLHYAVEIHRVARLVALAMKAVFDCEGVSTRQHNEPAGNQDVWHYHMHVTPRYQGDQFYTAQWKRMSTDERAIYADNLRSYFSQHSQED